MLLEKRQWINSKENIALCRLFPFLSQRWDTRLSYVFPEQPLLFLSSASPRPLPLASARVFPLFVILIIIVLFSCSKHTACWCYKCTENEILIEAMIAMLKNKATLSICALCHWNQTIAQLLRLHSNHLEIIVQKKKRVVKMLQAHLKYVSFLYFLHRQPLIFFWVFLTKWTVVQHLTRNIFHNSPPLCDHNNDDLPLCIPSHLFPLRIRPRQQSGGCWPEPPHPETCSSYLNYSWRIITCVGWVCWAMLCWCSTLQRFCQLGLNA